MNFVSAWRNSGRRTPIEPPLRAEVLDLERLQDHARALAARFTIDPRRRRRRLLARLEDNARVLSQTYRLLADDVRARLYVSPAGEWMLDNYHLVVAEIRVLREYLPRRYYAKLPTLAATDRVGDVRAYALAVEVVRHSDSRLDRQQLVAFLTSYQTVAPLTIGELWAFPSMLRLALLENLRRLADEILVVREARQAADRYVSRLEEGASYDTPNWPSRSFTSFVVQLLHRIRDHGPILHPVQAAIDAELEARGTSSDDVVREEHQRQATAQVLVANVITSLRLCASLDWRQLFESVSVVEQVLRRDPIGRLRADGLPRPRPPAARRSRCWPSPMATRRYAWRCGRWRAPAKALPALGTGGPRRLPPDRRRPAPVRVAGRVPSDVARAARPVHPRQCHAHLPRLDRTGDRHFSVPRRPGPGAPRRRGRRARHRRAAAGAAAQRRGGGARQPAGHGAGHARAAAAARLRRRHPGQRADDGHRADAVHQPRRRAGAARAARGGGAGQPRSPPPLRSPERRRTTPRPSTCRRTPRWSRPRWRASRRSTASPGPRAGIASSSSIASGVGIPASTPGWAGSASAARSRSSTAGCAARPTPATSSRSAPWICCRRSATA